MIGRRISQPSAVSAAESAKQLRLYLYGARPDALAKVDIAYLSRRYGVPRAQIERELEAARRARGGLL